MDTILAIAIMAVASIIIILLINNQNKKTTSDSEAFGGAHGIKARAYHSCPPGNCEDKKVTKDMMLVKNPFLWPYSGATNPESVMENEETQPVPEVKSASKTVEKFASRHGLKRMSKKKEDGMQNIYDMEDIGSAVAETDHELGVN